MYSINQWIGQSNLWTDVASSNATATDHNILHPFAGATVLVVDDDPTQRLLARDALEGTGFKVKEAADGPDGVVEAYANRPDLVILDIVMPGLDGLTVCAELRRHRTTKHVPILIVTGVDDARAIQRGFELGATDFIVKPVAWELLALRLKFVLRNHVQEERSD